MKGLSQLLFVAAKRMMASKYRKIALLIAFGGLALLFGGAFPAAAHPVPFSYLDVRIEPGTIDLTTRRTNSEWIRPNYCLTRPCWAHRGTNWLPYSAAACKSLWAAGY
jgi:hypothetical protein